MDTTIISMLATSAGTVIATVALVWRIIGTLRSDMDTKINGLRGELRSAINGLRGELRSDAQSRNLPRIAPSPRRFRDFARNDGFLARCRAKRSLTPSCHSARSEAESQNLHGLCMPSLARGWRLRPPPVPPSVAGRPALQDLRSRSAAPTGSHPRLRAE